MGPGQRTVLRVAVAGTILVYLLYHFHQSGIFTKDNASGFGICLIALGAFAFFLRPKIDEAMPDLQERLTPVVGYGLPKWGQTATYYLIVGLGVALIVWSLTPMRS